MMDLYVDKYGWNHVYMESHSVYSNGNTKMDVSFKQNQFYLQQMKRNYNQNYRQ